MKKILLISTFLTIAFVKFSFGQTNGHGNSNPYFDIVDIDNSGKVTQVKLLTNRKVNHDTTYQALFVYDFDKNGKSENVFYSFGSQGFARFLMSIDGNLEPIDLYNDMFDLPEDKEGFWFYAADIFGDQTPEIIIFSKIGESCFVKIINYSTTKRKFVEQLYRLNDLALSKQLLVKNQGKIIVPIGSQGLFDEIPLIIE